MLIYMVPVYRRIALTEDQAKACSRSGDIMAEQSAPAIAGTAPTTAGLEPDAISVAQDSLIGLADTGPTVSVSFTLVLLIIANAYRRLNLWNANCGQSAHWQQPWRPSARLRRRPVRDRRDRRITAVV